MNTATATSKTNSLDQDKSVNPEQKNFTASSDAQKQTSTSFVSQFDTQQHSKKDENGIPNPVYLDFFQPKYFEPHLQLIHIPEDCPTTVTTLLNESFKLFS